MKNNNLTVQNLRKNHQMKVRIWHSRMTKGGFLIPANEITDYNLISCFGGKTEVFLRTKDGVEVKGEAVCSKRDAFNKKVGVRIALQRASSELGNQSFIDKTINKVKDWLLNSDY